MLLHLRMFLVSKPQLNRFVLEKLKFVRSPLVNGATGFILALVFHVVFNLRWPCLILTKNLSEKKRYSAPFSGSLYPISPLALEPPPVSPYFSSSGSVGCPCLHCTPWFHPPSTMFLQVLLGFGGWNYREHRQQTLPEVSSWEAGGGI